MSRNETHYSPITTDHARDKHLLARELRRNMTPAERRLWHAFKGERLHGLHFRRQQPILGFVVDFYCHRLRLVIEVDGPIHDTSVEYDRERDAVLKGVSLTVLRFTNEQIFRDLLGVLTQITDTAKQLDRSKPISA